MWTANWMNTRAPDVTLPSDLPKRFVAFHERHPEPSHDQPAPDRRVSGAPHRQTWSYFDDPQHGVECGVWACETGMWRIRFAPDKLEFFSVIEGHVRLHDADGDTHDVRTGEAGVIPAGFVGMFEVVSPVRKYFVVMQGAQ